MYHIAGKINPCEKPEFQVENHLRDLVNPFSLDNTIADQTHHGHHLDEESGLLIEDISQERVQAMQTQVEEYSQDLLAFLSIKS